MIDGSIHEANGPKAKQIQPDSHDTLLWLISISLDGMKSVSGSPTLGILDLLGPAGLPSLARIKLVGHQSASFDAKDGKSGAESVGVVDVLAIRKDHRHRLAP